MSEKSGETSLMFAIGIIVLLCWLFWYFWQAEITYAIGYTRLGYLWSLGLVTDQFNPYYIAVQKRLEAGPGALNWPQLQHVSTLIGDWMKYPVTLFLAYGAYWMLMITPKRKFKTVFNLESLIAIQAKCWPIISPIINFNPLKDSQRIPGTKVPRVLPPFAESLSPEEWVAWHHMPLTDGVPDKEDLRQAFTKQLGTKYEGMKSLKEHQRALMAAFALRGAQKRSESDELLGQIAQCWTRDGGLKLTPEIQAKVNAVLGDKAVMEMPLKIAAQHAYITTALLGVLRWARENGGVLAPASFLWVRGADRSLWYPLNNLGRRSYHAEAAGAMAHFMAEQIAKRPLPIPRVDTAIPAIIDYLKESSPKYPEAEPLSAGNVIRDTAKLKMS